MAVTDTDFTSTMTPTSCNEVDTAVVDDDIKSPFENLPSEIRNEIYSLVLVKDEPIYLRLFEPNHGEKRVVPQGWRNQGKHRGQVWQPFCPRRWIDAPPAFNALLRVNSTVAAEAAPILYSKNRVAFDMCRTAIEFVEQIEDSKVHLCYITICSDWSMRRGMVMLLSVLTDATSLRKLELHIYDHWRHRLYARSNVDAERELVALFKPFLTVLHHSYRRQRLSASVLDVVQQQGLEKFRKRLEFDMRFILSDEATVPAGHDLQSQGGALVPEETWAPVLEPVVPRNRVASEDWVDEEVEEAPIPRKRKLKARVDEEDEEVAFPRKRKCKACVDEQDEEVDY